MLDSTLDKILRSKQVAMPLDPDNPKNSDQFQEPTSNSEAEVRLVIRFIVEEHIVYNGKVERVNQLESEELSRVVSRVAWNESKEGRKSLTKSADTIHEQTVDDTNDSKRQDNVPSVDDCTDPPPTNFQPTANPNPVNDITIIERDTNVESSGQIFSDSDHLLETEQIVNQQESAAQESSSVNDVCPATLPSDISSESIVIEQCETIERTTRDPPIFQEKDDETGSVSNTMMIGEENHHDACPLDESMTESQSVADALNECVANVDIECRNDNERSVCLKVELGSMSNPPIEQLRHLANTPLLDRHENVQDENVQARHNKSPIEMISIPSDHNEEPIQSHDVDLSEGYIVEEVVQNEQEITTDPSIVPLQPQESTSAKRKANDSQTPKRNRKDSSRESKSSKSKLVTKSRQNSISDQTKTVRGSTPVSIIANSQSSQSKIFAKWSDNHYYPGTILRPARDRKFVVGFYDGAQRNVSEADLIPLRNIEGKQVRVSIAKNYCVNAFVHDQRSPVNDQPMFDVEYQQDGLVRRCVPLKDIFLTGEQGTPLINQVDRSSGASNFADVDLDNIIYEKRSRRLQEMGDFELTENSSVNHKRKRGQYNVRQASRIKNDATSVSPNDHQISVQRPHPQANDDQNRESFGSIDVVKSSSLNSNPPSEGSSPVVSSNISNDVELDQDFYFESSSPHRTKTSLLL